MRPREFLDLARDVVQGTTEVRWRGGVIHAYYALVLECRDALVRWSRPASSRDVHRQVRLAFVYATDPDLHAIGVALDELSQLRAHANYAMAPGQVFATPTKARNVIQRVATALALLDAIDADPTRRAAAVAALPP